MVLCINDNSVDDILAVSLGCQVLVIVRFFLGGDGFHVCDSLPKPLCYLKSLLLPLGIRKT